MRQAWQHHVAYGYCSFFKPPAIMLTDSRLTSAHICRFTTLVRCLPAAFLLIVLPTSSIPPLLLPPQLFFAKVPPTAPGSEVEALFGSFGKLAEVNLFRAWAGAKHSKVGLQRLLDAPRLLLWVVHERPSEQTAAQRSHPAQTAVSKALTAPVALQFERAADS